MSIRSSRWPAGIPCWADLSVPNVNAVTDFYAHVFGWEFNNNGPEYGDYLLATKNGTAAAGIGPQPQPGIPASWTLYFASDNSADTVASITENGGTILAEPMDIGPLGRMCIASDPTGAVFGLWEAGTFIGASLVNEPGGFVWEDLRSTDPQTARTFYSSVFDYRLEELEMAGPDYVTFALPDDEGPLGGIGGMSDDIPQGCPSHWLVYFVVENTATAVAAARENGGGITVEPFDTPYGKMAGLTDPAGATFYIVESDGEGTPDRSK